jgi:hypothetical protein
MTRDAESFIVITPSPFAVSKPYRYFLSKSEGKNACLLQSVEWRHDSDLYENHIDIIKSCITQTKTPPLRLKEADIWNDEDQFVNFIQTMRFPNSGFRWNNDRLLRLDADDVSANDSRYRFTFTIRYDDEKGTMHIGEAAYELRTRRVKDSEPVQATAPQVIMDEMVKVNSKG